MADHVRQQIREAVATLVTGLTTTASRVYQSRVYPLADGNLPGLLIYTTEETSEPVTMGSTRLLDRSLTLTIEGYCEGISNIDDTCDTIAKEVETAVSGQTLSGKAKDIYLGDTAISYDGSGAKPIGYVTLNFIVLYFTEEDAPDVAK